MPTSLLSLLLALLPCGVRGVAARVELTSRIAQLARETAGGARSTAAQAAAIEEAVQSLEKTQLTQALDPAAACGVWSQLYCDNPAAGTVAGDGRSSRRQLIGPISGRVTQRVLANASGGMPSRYEQRATAGKGLLEARLEATIVQTPYAGAGPLVWTVAFETFAWRWLGVPLRSRRLPPGRGGEWRTTYLDDEWRVMRAGSMRGDGAESLYVLRRLS